MTNKKASFLNSKVIFPPDNGEIIDWIERASIEFQFTSKTVGSITMNNENVHREMLINVAVALGTELFQKMVFVGGCTTSLLLTDAFTIEQVRHTDDVDLIIHKDREDLIFSRLESVLGVKR